MVAPHEWLLTAGVAAPLGLGLSAGPEVLASTQEGGGVGAFAAQGTGLELLGMARFTTASLWAAAGAGAGLTAGVGTPSARVLLQVGATLDTGLGWSGAEAPAAAPDAPPTALAPPPEAEPDADGDTVPDAVDACPEQAGDAAPTAPRRGCPTLSAAEACAAGVAPPGPAPCPEAAPVDTDGDGFADATDACPAEAGVADADPQRHGCPRSVRVEAGQIVITEQVQFATGSDRIEPQSFPLLEQVAAALTAHPEIARVAVDGHTDDAGLPLANLELSRRRAMAVMRWLTAHGVDERRLEARGFGQRQPLVRERTPEARSRNRRVEFQILERTPRGAAGWHDGPVEREGAP